MTEPVERPDIGAITPDYLHLQMLIHLRKAERAEAAWLERDAANLARHRRKGLSEKEARINAAIDQPGDPLLRLHGWMQGHHRDWARTYADAYLVHLAHTKDRPVPPAGRNPGPRPVAPAAPGVRPGTGPSLQVGTGLIGAAPSGRRGR